MMQIVDSSEAVTAVEHERSELIDLLFSDLAGGAKALTIPSSLLEQTLRTGYRFDGSAVTGGARQLELDLYLHPDPRTLVMLPASQDSPARARLCCSVHRRDGQPFDGDPRSVLERALHQARAMGFDYAVGVEMEFYLIRGGWNEAPAMSDAAGYFDVGVDAAARARDDLMTTLQSLGVAIGGAHHETGPGQEEIDLLPVAALQMADQLMSVRQVIRTVAQRHGLKATFMPKPFADAPGSGLHIFQQLRHTETGVDALRSVGDQLSPAGYMAIGGQLNHAPGMSVVLNPTVNSYKRLNDGHRAPRYATWAYMSQTSLIRVPGWAEGEVAALELRSPDALCNPYLALAVALTSAIDGIKTGEEAPEPLEEGLSTYDDAGMERIGVPRLPATLGEALQAVARDPVVQSALGSYIYDRMVAIKRAEWEEYRAHVGPWEHRRYGDA